MENVVSIFLDLVKIASPSKGERALADEIIKRCQRLGLEVIEDHSGEKIGGNCGNLIVQLEGEGTPILFDAHMDSVEPCARIHPVIQDGTIYSNKTSVLGADDKAGIAVMLCMLENIITQHIPHPPITCIFSICEEEGLRGVKELDKKYYEDVRYAYVLDGEGEIGTVVSKTPFGCKGTLHIIGKEAHAGVEPEKGINALVVAAEAISKLTIGRVNSGLTCNIGTIKGGTATNVVMKEVYMQFEARGYRKDEVVSWIERVKDVFQTTCQRHGAIFENDLRYGTPGYTIEDSEPILTTFHEICDKIGFPFHSVPCGGGSNASVYHMHGMSALCVGTNMQEVHSCDEHIRISDLLKLEILVMGIVENMKR